MMRKVVAALLWMAAGSLLVHGQLASGTMNRRVTDAQGASVARAHATVKSLAQGTVPRAGEYVPAPHGGQWFERLAPAADRPQLAGSRNQEQHQLNAAIDRWNALPACPAAFPCLAGGTLQHVPADINFYSPFSSLDLRLKKDVPLSDRIMLSLVGEGFNMFNETNIRGTSNNNYAGRNIAISPYQPAQNGQPAQAVQSDFYSPVTTAGGFFGSGGPRAFQFAARLTF
jgi:hypothetical protein